MNAVRGALLNEGRDVPVVKLCRWLGVPRSTAYYQPRQRKARPLDEALALVIFAVLQAFPTFGIRRVWAYLRFRLKWRVNRKRVARLMRAKGWTLKQRRVGGRPRTDGSRSVAERPDERWATDIALVFCGAADGWCSFVPVVDCCTRQVLGWELAPTARAKTAERALEAALLSRFGTTRGAPEGLTIRHDNGLVFGSRLYRAVTRDYALRQEFITPYTPQQNGLVERFIRSFKEECAWQHNFGSLAA
ncbi:MAG: IS3 family transposase [Planctomycetota bacterium]|nr:IS3 family transposase [Planctomycetota bacterium]